MPRHDAPALNIRESNNENQKSEISSSVSLCLCVKNYDQNTAIGFTGDPEPPSTGIGANVSMNS
jgi:hypothetical protein